MLNVDIQGLKKGFYKAARNMTPEIMERLPPDVLRGLLLTFWVKVKPRSKSFDRSAMASILLRVARLTTKVFQDPLERKQIQKVMYEKIWGLLSTAKELEQFHLAGLVPLIPFKRHLVYGYLRFPDVTRSEQTRLVGKYGNLIRRIYSVRSSIAPLKALLEWDGRDIDTLSERMVQTGINLPSLRLHPRVKPFQFQKKELTRTIRAWEDHKKNFLRTLDTKYLFWGNYVITKFAIKCFYYLTRPLIMLSRREWDDTFFGATRIRPEDPGISRLFEYLETIRAKYETCVRTFKKNQGFIKGSRVERDAWNQMYNQEAETYASMPRHTNVRKLVPFGGAHLGMFQLVSHRQVSCLDLALLETIAHGFESLQNGIHCQAKQGCDTVTHFGIPDSQGNFRKKGYQTKAIAKTPEEIYEIFTAGMGWRIREYHSFLMETLRAGSLPFDPSWHTGLEMFSSVMAKKLRTDVGFHTVFDRKYS